MHRSLIALVAALAIPASASATTYCVKNPDCEQAGGTHEDDLQVALQAAAQNPGRDDVSLGAGTFVGNFTSVDPAGVTIGGLPGKTVLQPGLFGYPAYPSVLALDGPGRITGLRVSLGSAEGAQGISLAGGATADTIDVDGTGVDQGAAQLDDATLSDSTVELAGDDTIGVRVVGGGATLDRDAITAYASVSAMGAGGSTTRLHALRLRPLYDALAVASGDVQVTDSVIDLHALSIGRGIYVGPATGVAASVDARNITIAGSGSASQLGIDASLFGGGRSASIRVRDSVLYGLGTPVRRSVAAGSSATVTLDRVERWPDHPLSDTPGNGQLTDTNPLAVEPGFTDPAGADFSLTASSPLVDAGAPGALDAGEPDTDVTGALRITDGNGDCGAQRDIGAFERAAATCVPAPVATGSQPQPQQHQQPAPVAIADTTAPAFSRVKLRRRGRALVVRFRLSEQATVRVKTGKRAISKRLAAGARTIKLRRVSRRRLRVVLTATDPAGNRARVTRRIR